MDEKNGKSDATELMILPSTQSVNSKEKDILNGDTKTDHFDKGWA